MNSSSDHSDEFFREQLRQLQAKGYSPEKATEILLQAQKAVLLACRKLLEQCRAGQPLTEQKRPPCGGENDADVNGQAQP